MSDVLVAEGINRKTNKPIKFKIPVTISFFGLESIRRNIRNVKPCGDAAILKASDQPVDFERFYKLKTGRSFVRYFGNDLVDLLRPPGWYCNRVEDGNSQKYAFPLSDTIDYSRNATNVAYQLVHMGELGRTTMKGAQNYKPFH